MRVKKLLPLIILVVLLILFFASGLNRYVSFEALKQNHQQLQAWTQQHLFFAAIIYMLAYMIAVAVSIPGAWLFTLVGGFLFGIVMGTILVVISATIGATIIFFATKTALADFFYAKASKWLRHFEAGFRENEFNYLLFLRLVPLFPFWLINIVAGLLNVSVRDFVVATFLGIIPGSAVYVAVGNGLSSIFAENKTLHLNIIFQPKILIPILLLAILSIVPVIYKKYKTRKIGNDKT